MLLHSCKPDKIPMMYYYGRGCAAPPQDGFGRDKTRTTKTKSHLRKMAFKYQRGLILCYIAKTGDDAVRVSFTDERE